MKKNSTLFLFAITLCLLGCNKAGSDSGSTLSGGVPKLISESNGWHILGGQRVPLSTSEVPAYLQYENGHLTQFYYGQFYANSQITTLDYARCNMKGDSIYCKQVNAEYLPFFYKEGDASDVRYGVYWSQASGTSSHSPVGIASIGAATSEMSKTLYAFPSISRYSFKFANPDVFMYYEGNIAGIKAYRIGSGIETNLYSSAQTTTFSDMSFKGTLTIDEDYCKANPSHLKAYYASHNNGISYNGHSPNYISIYSVDDINKTIFKDSVSIYREQASGGYDYKVSCNDANNVYFFLGNYTFASTLSSDDHNTLMIVYNKATQKITRSRLLSALPYANNVVIIPSKNQIFLTTNNSIFKLDLATDALSNITPQFIGGNNASYAITTDGNKLFASVGSYYMQYSPAVTNVLYYE